MTKNEARKILKVHNEWRRDFRTGKMQSAFDVGQAIDVLCEPPLISQALRDAAVNWPQFLSDEDCCIIETFEDYEMLFKSCLIEGSKNDVIHAKTFMLFVAEALE